MNIKNTIFHIISMIVLLSFPFSAAQAEQLNVDKIISQLKSENPLEQLKAFNALGVDQEEVMSNLVDAVNEKPCAYQFLENFSLNELATDFIAELKKRVPPSTDLQSEYCSYYSMGKIQFPF